MYFISLIICQFSHWQERNAFQLHSICLPNLSEKRIATISGKIATHKDPKADKDHGHS